MSDVLAPPIAFSQRPRFDLAQPGSPDRKLRAVETAIAGAVWHLRSAVAKNLGRLSGYRFTRTDLSMVRATVPEAVADAVGLGGIAPDKARRVTLAARAMVAGHVVATRDREIREAALMIAGLALARCGRRVQIVCATAERGAQLCDRWRDLFVGAGLDAIAVPPDAPNATRRARYGAAVVFVDAVLLATDHLRDVRAGLIRRSGACHLAHAMAHGSEAGHRYLCGPLDVALVDGFAAVAVEAGYRRATLRDELDLITGNLAATEALLLARRMRAGEDYVPDDEGRPVLTEHGRQRAGRIALELTEPWSVAPWREATLTAAIEIATCLKKHSDYAVFADRVEFSDPARAERLGRGSLVTAEDIVLATESNVAERAEIVIEASIRQVLGRYRHLAGSTLPAPGLAADIWQLYALSVVGIAPCRVTRPGRVRVVPHADDDGKWAAVAGHVRAAAEDGRKTLLVAAPAPGKGDAIRARLPQDLHGQVEIATRWDSIEERMTGDGTSVLFVEADLHRWRMMKLAEVWRVRPGKTVALHLSRDDPALRPVRRHALVRGIEKVRRGSALAARVTLWSADRAGRRAMRATQGARLRWETAMQGAFGFAGGKE